MEFFKIYLKSRKQCVKITNTYTHYDEIISGVLQGSIFGPIFFRLSINDLFSFIKITSTHNFADNNTLSACGEIVPKLFGILESESIITIDCLKKMIINQDKFQVIILYRKKSSLKNTPLTIDNHTATSVPSL